MSKIKLAGAGAKYAGKKISEVLKRLKRNKAAKKSKANIEKIGRGTKSISRYNIRARAADEKVIPVKGQSQKGSSFKPHKVRGTGPGSRVGFETRESWRDEMERMYGDISISKFFKKSTGGDINKPMKKTLSEKQKKIASKAPPYDEIGGNDFAVLKKEKAKGRGMGLQDESVKPGKVMKAKVGKEMKADPTKTITDKGQFIKRRKQLMGLGKATRLGRTAALVGAGLSAAAAGIGKAVKEYKDYKSAKNRDAAKVSKNRMGGGMMNKPMGYSKGTMIMARGCKLGRKKATKIT